MLDVPLPSRQSVCCVPQVHGSTELAKRRRTIYFRAENFNVAEHRSQEVGNKEQICRSRCDTAEEHGDGRCASPSNLPRTPAPSVPGVPASQVSSGVDVQPRSAAEINLLLNHAPNVGAPSLREAVVQLASSRACRRTGQKAGGSCGRGDCSAVRLHESRVVACSMLVVHHRVLFTHHLW